MKKSMLFLFCFFLIPVSICFATPPTSIDLSFDPAKGNLHVEAVHPSFAPDKSYVRLMNVYINGSQVSTTDYFRQDDPNKFIEDVPLTVQPGDVIKVDLFCSLGGEMAQEMTVPQPPGTSGGPSTDKGTDTSATDNATINAATNTTNAPSDNTAN